MTHRELTTCFKCLGSGEYRGTQCNICYGRGTIVTVQAGSKWDQA